MKKTLITLGTIGAAALPVASVVSCGNKKKNTIAPIRTGFFKTAAALTLDKLPIDASDAGKVWSEGPIYQGYQQLENTIITLAEMMGWNPDVNVVGNKDWFTTHTTTDVKAKAWELRKVETVNIWEMLGLPTLATEADGDTLAEGGLNMVKMVFNETLAPTLKTLTQVNAKMKEVISFAKTGINNHFESLKTFLNGAHGISSWTDLDKQLRIHTALGMDTALGAFGANQLMGTFQRNLHSSLYMGEETANNPWKKDSYGKNATNTELNYYNGGGSWGSLNKSIEEAFTAWNTNDKIKTILKIQSMDPANQSDQIRAAVFPRLFQATIQNYATFPDKDDPAARYISFTYAYGNIKIRKVMHVDNFNYVGYHKIATADTMKIYENDGTTVLKTVSKEFVMKEMLNKIVEKSLKTITIGSMMNLMGMMHDGSYSALKYIIEHAHDANNSIFADESLTQAALDKFYGLLNKGQISWPALYAIYVGLKDVPSDYHIPQVQEAPMHTGPYYLTNTFNIRPNTSLNRPNYQGLKDSSDLQTTLLAWAHKSKDSIYWIAPGGTPVAAMPSTGSGSGTPISGSNPAK